MALQTLPDVVDAVIWPSVSIGSVRADATSLTEMGRRIGLIGDLTLNIGIVVRAQRLADPVLRLPRQISAGRPVSSQV